MPQSIPAGLTRDYVLKTLADIDAGIDHPFGNPTGYEFVYEGRRYAPKAVVGLACSEGIPDQALHLARYFEPVVST